MTILIIPACVLACVAAYLIAGFRVALARRPVMWAKARQRWHTEDDIASSARWQFAVMVLFWVLMLPAQAFSRQLNATVTAGDPVARERRAAERERRIAELEAENERLRRQQEGCAP